MDPCIFHSYICVFIIPKLFYHLDPALIKLQFSNRNYISKAERQMKKNGFITS